MDDNKLPAPNVGGNIWKSQNCPAFTARKDAPIGLSQCWYCSFADFHINMPKPLEVGVCYYPQKILN